MKKSTFLSIFILIISCGFSPLLKNIDLSQLSIKELNMKGPTSLVFFTKFNLNIQEDKTIKDGNIINIKIEESITSAAKNSAGITTQEQVKIIIFLEVTNSERSLFSDKFEMEKVINITNNISIDNETKRIEKENIILNLVQKIKFTIQSELTNIK